MSEFPPPRTLTDRSIAEGKELREAGASSVIETPEARFEVLYGNHTQPQQHAGLERYDGILLELIYDRTQGDAHPGFIEAHPQYRELVQEAKRLGKPLFFPDISHYPDTATQEMLETVLGISLIGGAAVAGVASHKVKPMTRRAALGALLGLGAAGVISQERQARRAHNTLSGGASASDRIEFALRNDVIAQKSRAIASFVEAGADKPSLAVVIGALHGGLEASMQVPVAERVQHIDEQLRQIGELLGSGTEEKLRSGISLITRLDYDAEKQGWKASVVQDPQLAPLDAR